MNENREFDGTRALNETMPMTEPAQSGAEFQTHSEQTSNSEINSESEMNNEPEQGVDAGQANNTEAESGDNTEANESAISEEAQTDNNDQTQNSLESGVNDTVKDAAQGLEEIRNRVRNAESVFNAIKPRFQVTGFAAIPPMTGSGVISITDLLPRPKSSVGTGFKKPSNTDENNMQWQEIIEKHEQQNPEQSNENNMATEQHAAETETPQPESTDQQTTEEIRDSEQEFSNEVEAPLPEFTITQEEAASEQLSANETDNESGSFTEQNVTYENETPLEQQADTESDESFAEQKTENEKEQESEPDIEPKNSARTKSHRSLTPQQLNELPDESPAYAKLHCRVSDILKKVREGLAESEKAKVKNRIHPEGNDGTDNASDKPNKMLTVSTGGVLRGIGKKRRKTTKI